MTDQMNTTQNQQSQALIEKKTDITANVLTRVDELQKAGGLMLPKDYVPANALKAAYIILSDPKTNLLAKSSKESVAQALFKMVVWGLSPLKGQCYFVPYGDKLECVADYSGNILLAKRYGGLKDIKANAIFEGDDFDFGIDIDGRRKIIKHKQSLQSIDGKVIGAYAIYRMQDGTTDTEVMSMEMIKKSWEQGGAKGNSLAHKNFSDQMACKTVINRACKLIIRTSSDAILKDEETDEQTHEYKADANHGDIIDTTAIDVVDEEPMSIEEPALTDPLKGDSPVEMQF